MYNTVFVDGDKPDIKKNPSKHPSNRSWLRQQLLHWTHM